MIATTILAIGAIFLTACDESGSGGSGNGGTTYEYVCENGTKSDGDATADNINRCKSCRSGFNLTAAHTCVKNAYVCENGTPSGDDATADNITKCQSCAEGYVLTAAETCNHAYVCENGTPVDDTDATDANITKCKACSTGFELQDTACVKVGKYFCTNGTPRTGNTPSGQAEHLCDSCLQGFIITNDNRCNHAYVCSNGTPSTDTNATAANITKCQSCSGGFKKVGDTCVTTQYTCSNGSPVTGSKPSGNHDEEQCNACNCGFTLSGAACNTATLTVGDTNAVTCTVTNNTAFEVSLGTPVDGLWPVYQYKLGTNVELVSVSEGTTDVAERRYRTACPAASNSEVDLDPSDSDSATTSICDAGFTLLAPTTEGVYRLAVRPTSGNSSATLSLRIKDTGLTQLPYGADTQVGPSFTKFWYYMPVPVGAGSPHVQLINEGTGNSGFFSSVIHSLVNPSVELATGISFTGAGNANGNIANFIRSGNPYNPTHTTTQAIELLKVFDPSNNQLHNKFLIRFCNDNNNDNNCD